MKNDPGHDPVNPDENLFHHAFDNPEEASLRFDAPERDEWQMPDQVMAAFQLSQDATVVEIGCGTGYFAIRLGQHLKQGKVIALDREPKMAAYLQKRAEDLGLANVHAGLIHANGQAGLPEQVDLIFSVDTYHHLQNRAAFFARLLPYLKAGSRLVVIDRKESAPQGSHAKPRVAAETVKHELQAAGFAPVLELDFLPLQYFLVFEAA